MNETSVPLIPCNSSLENLQALINQHYRGLLPALKAALAVVGAMALKGRKKPLCLILESVSGRGKSAVIQMLFPLPADSGNGVDRYIYRSDKFTPKAFVSHVANVPRKDLGSIDMLPKLRDKVLVTKELAPIFRGRTDELEENFSTLITVLDGKGFTSNSGTQGERGYKSDIVFNWLGATTPISQHTYKIMSQLGTRLLFYWVPAMKTSEEELFKYAAQEDSGIAEEECQKAVNGFLLAFFSQYRVSSVEPESVTISEDRLLQMVRWAQLLATCRAGVKYEKTEDGRRYQAVAPNQSEGPYKIVNAFKALARGHALIHGRRAEVDDSDLALIVHVALSSIPEHFRSPLLYLRTYGFVSSATCERTNRVSRPTARKHMRELTLLGVTVTTAGDPESSQPESIALSPEFEWLREQPKEAPQSQETESAQEKTPEN